jgi:putative Mg2+ transporter-C (MgtC) family protein
MLVSIDGFPRGIDRDPARLAAQVISGIGFLGAGTILRDGTSVRGLTTAASLWVVAGIGLAVGTGFYWAAVVTTFFAVVVLMYLDNLERKFISTSTGYIEIEVSDQPGTLAAITKVFADYGVSIKKINLEIEEENQKAVVTLQVRGHNNDHKERLFDEIRLLPGIYRVKWR